MKILPTPFDMKSLCVDHFTRFGCWFTMLLWLLFSPAARSQADFYGMTSGGGPDGMGVIFKIKPDGSGYQIIHAFNSPAPGGNPQGSLTLAANGKLYGMTYYGGHSDGGVIFEYTPESNTYTRLKSFNLDDGAHPFGNLVEFEGKLYGMTWDGGSGSIYDRGVLFEFDPATHEYVKKVLFDDNIGALPLGSLTPYNGKLYGMTSWGGVEQAGVIFSYEPATHIYQVLKEFDGDSGYKPNGSLLLFNNKLYGLTEYGGAGAFNGGTLFEFDPTTNEYIKKIDFTSTIGTRPRGSLIECNGKLYGMTSEGGGGPGVLFEYDPMTNGYTKKISFDGSNGGNPHGDLTKVNGKLYGMTSWGGARNDGVVFEFNPATNEYFIKTDFNSSTGMGSQPFGSLTIYGDKLFGMTSSGGASNQGVIFSFDPATDTYDQKINLNLNEGYQPWGTLTEYQGKLYGMTLYGGAFDLGVIFEYDTLTHIYARTKDFNDDDGSLPLGQLVEFNNKLYGMTSAGGNGTTNTVYDGVLFEYTPETNAYLKKFVFSDVDLGQRPYGSLTLYNNKLYGMTSLGGIYINGVIFEYDPISGAFLKKLDLDLDIPNGEWGPTDRLTEFNGKLYGLTYAGGTANKGVLFEYNPTSNGYLKKKNFNDAIGTHPKGSLTQLNGKLYGLTSGGGAFDSGVLFEYNPAMNIYLKKKDLNSGDGQYPRGSLVAYNGKLYGMTQEGGSHNKGVVFEYEPLSNTYSLLHNFDFDNGAYPKGNLIVAGQVSTQTTSATMTADVSVFPNPAAETVYFYNTTASKGCINIIYNDGRLISSLELNGFEQKQYRVSDLPPGVIQWQWLPKCNNIEQSGKLIIMRE